MSDKKHFSEPEILSETSLDQGQQGFPLMPLTALSGGVSDVADTAPPDGINFPNGVD